MSPLEKRIVVVLGMHRCGTSTITRALSVLGVDLGNNLLPPLPGDNAKGFFEDIDLLALNIEILRALGSDWHCVAPIEATKLETLYSNGFFSRAVALMQQKTTGVSIFGFKDPRVTKLLPFWTRVFEHSGFDTSYVLAIRNPLSVVQSLAKRDGFPAEKTYLLWLEHTILSLVHTRQYRRVLIDYDHFLHAPHHDLKRIAKRLGLRIDSALLQVYRAEFLDEGLRHSIFTLSDLTTDTACPPLARELYAALLEILRANKRFDRPAFHARSEHWAAEYARLQSSLRWIDRLCVAMTDREHTNQCAEAQRLLQVGHEETLSRELQTSRQVHEQQQRESAAREDAALSQLALARQQIESQVSAMAERENTHSCQLRQLQQAHVRQRNKQRREHVQSAQALRRQLVRATQEIDRLTRELSDREAAYPKKLNALERRNEQQRREHATREREGAAREHTLLKRLQEAQQSHEQEATRYAASERELLTRLTHVQQQMAKTLYEQAALERSFTEQLRTSERAHEQERAEHVRNIAERERLHTEELAVRTRDLADMADRSAQAQEAHEQLCAKLNANLAETRSTYRWIEALRPLLFSLRPTASARTSLRLLLASPATTIMRVARLNFHPPSSLSPNAPTTPEMVAVPPTSNASAGTLGDMLSRHDEDFVRCAYQALLGRAPDPEGMTYYLNRIRGGVSREEVIAQLRLSNEGSARQVEIDGLNTLIRRHRIRKSPLLGLLFHLFYPKRVGRSLDQKFRALENSLALLDQRMLQQFADLRQAMVQSTIGSHHSGGVTHKEVPHSDSPSLVSIVIPIFDRTDVLRIAIRSALSQTYKNIEVILVTDGSPPETMAVVHEFSTDSRVRIFDYPTSSGTAVRGRNKGILEANGHYIAFLDSDDLAMSDRIALSLPLLESGHADVVYGAWRAMLDGTRNLEGLTDGQVVYSPDCDAEMLKRICVPCQSTVMVRKDLFYAAGFLKPKMRYREDHELWARLAYFGARFRSISQPLVHLRLHSGNNEINFKSDDAHWESLVAQEYSQIGLIPRKIAFVVAGLGISGGMIVILKHAAYLMSVGHDVLLINVGEPGDLLWAGATTVPIVGINDQRRYLFQHIDLLFATFWATCEWLPRISAKRKLYFVQSDERLFYDDAGTQKRVGETYSLRYEFVTIAKWLSDFLATEFSKHSYLVPNGIDTTLFHPRTPLFPKDGRSPRVLIEGPISVSFKGVADACAAVAPLDCEIWIVSSAGTPPPDWRVDRFFHAVAFQDMPGIYSSCDVLLKMSRVESFSYPPLEAMACGCASVIAKVSGSIEYAIDGVNALIVEQSDIEGARRAVTRLLDDFELRARIIKEGYRTANNWTWDRSFKAMSAVIDGISPPNDHN